MQNQRKEAIYTHFQQIASNYLQYRKRFSYYGNDIINYCNFFISDTDTVLEIGCGHGETIGGLKGADKTGIDFSENMIAAANASFPNVHFRVMDAENITLEKKFDVIIFNNIIGYLDNIQDVFYAIKKNCHEHTRIIISYYNHYWEPILNLGETIGYKARSPQQNWLDTKDISNLLYLSGFETYRTNKRLLLPIYIPILSWLVNKYIAKLPLFKSLCLNQFTFARPQLNYSEADIAEKYSVSICIPARNESGNIENAILRLPKFGKHQEIIFIEGN
ncbi:MAG TPA: methyltransferase domain-containing protein, partial [Chitinophagales bacterium]|nr:methyltransferase domain-containing protein [Chitinophagales bacterium]